MDRLRDRSLRVTAVLLVTSVVLLAPGTAGFGGTVALALVLAVLAGVLFVARERLAGLPTLVGFRLGRYGRDLWIAPLFGALVVVATLETSPGELQALGGIAGFLGMANYFLRPVYLFGASLVAAVAGRTG